MTRSYSRIPLPRDKANFEYWLVADVWSLCEAASLVNGLEPKGRNWNGIHGIRDEEKRILDLAERAIQTDSLKLRPEDIRGMNSFYWDVVPSVFIAWAASKGWEIPEPLRGLIETTDLPNDSEGDTPVGWLTSKEATDMVIKGMDNTVTREYVKPKLSKACTTGKIQARGTGRQRRISPDSLKAFILDMRDKALEDD